MTNQEARKVFDAAVAKTADADQVARLEICREYLTNPAFARALADRLWATRR